MDLKQLEAWIKTDEGAAWLDTQKEGLAKKNTELLRELKSAGGGLSEISQRLADSEKALEIERAAIRQVLLERPLENSLSGKVFPVIIPTLREELIQTYGLDVKTIGDGSRAAMGFIEQDGEKVEKPLCDIIEHWTKTENAKSYLMPQKTTIESTCIAVPAGHSHTQHLDGLSGRELAAMSETDFQTAIKDKLR